jgi:hypothetical protein
LLTRFQDIADALSEAAEGTLRSAGVLQVSRYRNARRMSAPEAHVIQNSALLEEAQAIRDKLANVHLDALEAHVLYRHVWQRLPLRRLADFLNVTEIALAQARDELVKKITVAAFGVNPGRWPAGGYWSYGAGDNPPRLT